MSKEYYTPTIEEFHIGFEYRLIGENNTRIFSTNCTIDTTLSEVKYLDKLDIESLGFIGQEANSVYFKKDNIRLVHWLNDPIRVTSIYKIYSAVEKEKIFDGTIKNISELKVLLKQLNIHD